MDGAIFEYHFYEFMRIIAEDVIQKVELIDNFQHPKTGLVNHRYCITYKSWDRYMDEKEVTSRHNIMKQLVASNFLVNVLEY